MLNRDVTDELHHVDGFAHTGTAEETDFTAFGERAKQVNNLDAGFQQFGGVRQLVVSGGFAVNAPVGFGFDFRTVIDFFAEHVHDATKRRLAHRHGNRLAGVFDFHAAHQALGGTHGDGAHNAVAQLLLYFKDGIALFGNQRVVDFRHCVFGEFDIDDRADDLNYFTGTHLYLFLIQSVHSHGCSAADDLRQLLRNRGLTGFVVLQFELANEIGGIVRCVFHGDHPRRHFAGDVFRNRLFDH